MIELAAEKKLSVFCLVATMAQSLGLVMAISIFVVMLSTTLVTGQKITKESLESGEFSEDEIKKILLTDNKLPAK